MCIVWLLDDSTNEAQVDVYIRFVGSGFSSFENIGNAFEYTFVLTNYPDFQEQEMDSLVNFVISNLLLKKTIGVRCIHRMMRDYLVKKTNEAIKSYDESYLQDLYQERLYKFKNSHTMECIPKCKQCYEKKCHTKFVSHTTSIESALLILKSGVLKSLNQLRREGVCLNRESDRHPQDYDDGIFFVYANCFQPEYNYFNSLPASIVSNASIYSKLQGARFYFLNSELKKDKRYVIDGFHVCRINDELPLSPYLKAVLLPLYAKSRVPDDIQMKYKEKLIFTDFKRMSYSEVVHSSYEIIRKL